ncbi:beta-ketoacyl synthase N-terminal-like domain-containing protein [Actinokineospora sp.]|uniref:beta-ketoacyl synthase N-terminal-like domain-containing protein n=1 Tax=Actinokineospora sp. TaxID=1872133 RepID=UPI003D6B15DD
MTDNRSVGVITGVGVVAPTGVGVAEHWSGTLAARSRLGPITSFDAAGLPMRVVGEVAGFAETGFVPNKLRVQTDRWTWMALAATTLAFADADLDPAAHNPYDLSVVTASSSGGNAFGQREIHALWSEGPRAVSAYQSIGWFYAASSGQISIRDQLKGACGVIVADGAGGIDAVASAGRSIRRGTKAVLVGGTEAALSPYAIACQAGLGTLSTDADPATAYRPFAPDAGGSVLGEGGALLVVEDPEFARDRGARVYAEIAATASTHDAESPTGIPTDSRGLVRAMRMAVERAGLRQEDIDVVFADAVGERVHDAIEADAITEVFGGRAVPVAVPKTMTGRLNSGGAALDLAWAALAIRHGVIPPSVNLPDGFVGELDVVTAMRPAPQLRTALVVARGIGGFNSAAVVRAAD